MSGEAETNLDRLLDQANGRIWAVSALFIDLLQREAKNRADPEAWIRERFNAIPVPADHGPPDAIAAFVQHLAQMKNICLMDFDNAVQDQPTPMGFH